MASSGKDGSPTLCAYPFVQLSTVPAGFYRPCCYFTRMLDDRHGRLLSIAEDKIESVWNGPDMRKIRQQMLRGEAVGNCDQCYKEEALGSTSLRHRSLHEWEHNEGLKSAVADAATNDGRVSTPPRYFELKPGNLCNLKCRMCNQFDSSSIATELKVMAEKYKGLIAKSDSRLFDKTSFTVDFDDSKMVDWSQAPVFWADVEKFLPYVEFLSFAGGEPTLIPEVERLLKACVASGHSKQMRVFFSSNFTRLDDWLFDVAAQFKVFEFIASIDGKEKVQEYVRHPSKWKRVSENYQRVSQIVDGPNIKLVVNLTLQMYNILSFTDLMFWLDENLPLVQVGRQLYPYALNILYNPRYLNIDILPSGLRPLAIERIQKFVAESPILKRCDGLYERFDLIVHQLRQLPPRDYETQLKKFWGYTNLLDYHRGQKLVDVDPELYEAVEVEMRRMDMPLEVTW